MTKKILHLPATQAEIEKSDLPEHIKEILSSEHLTFSQRECILEILNTDDHAVDCYREQIDPFFSE